MHIRMQIKICHTPFSLTPAYAFVVIIKLMARLWTKINTKENPRQSPLAISGSPTQ